MKTNMHVLKSSTMAGFLIICLMHFAHAQELISSSGDYSESGDASISWSIGEPLVETYETGDNILTQGFHQTKLTITGIFEYPDSEIEVDVYPNPVSNYIFLDCKKYRDISYSLLDLNGRHILTNTPISDKTRISLNDLPPATYLLHVRDNEKKIKTYKIVKQ